LRRLQLKNRD